MRSIHTQAAVLSAPRGNVAIESIYVGEPGPGEVLVRMEACGICHSELYVAKPGEASTGPRDSRARRHRARGSDRSRGDGMGAGRPRGHHVPRSYLRRLRVVPQRARAILPQAGQLRIFPARRADRLCCGARGRTGASSRDNWRPSRRRRCAAPAGRPGARCGRRGSNAGQTVGLFGLGGLGHLALQMARHRGLRVAAVDISESKLEMAQVGRRGDHGPSRGRRAHAAEAARRRGRGHRVDALAGRHPTGLPLAEAHRDAGAGGDLA